MIDNVTPILRFVIELKEIFMSDQRFCLNFIIIAMNY